jgi:cysteinyl-tRNA synthetase
LDEPARIPIKAEPLIDLLVSIRNDLRNAKQWQLADKVRDQLSELGIVLEDSGKGTGWRQNK